MGSVGVRLAGTWGQYPDKREWRDGDKVRAKGCGEGCATQDSQKSNT